MRRLSRTGAAGLLAASLAAGTAADGSAPPAPRMLGGYHVLSGDFHVHSFPLTWSTLSPWDTVIEARRQGLDVIAMTPHSLVWAAHLGRWFADHTGGPIVIVGEEIASSRYHLIAAGISERISPSLGASQAIDEVHRQGGVAIAAHPYRSFWPAYDDEAMRKLDGAEVVRPESQHDERAAAVLHEFFNRAPLAAIASSDYHGMATMGYCRTFVFTRERSARAVVEAIREGRTVVFDRGSALGDPPLVELALKDGTLDRGVPNLPVPGAARWFSRIAAVLGLLLAWGARGVRS